MPYPDDMNWDAHDRAFGDCPIEAALEELPAFVYDLLEVYRKARKLDDEGADIIADALHTVFHLYYSCGSDEDGAGWGIFLGASK